MVSLRAVFGTLAVGLIFFRYGKSIQGYGRVPFHNNRPWRHCDHCLLGYRPNFDLNHPILLPMESILGIQAPRVVSSTHAALNNGSVCTGLVCRRSGKELDQPASWDWPGNLCHGHLPGAVGLVLTQKGE